MCTFFFWVMAIDWHFPGLHARGRFCPRHAEYVNGWDGARMELGAVKRAASSSQADAVMRVAEQRILWKTIE